jgi:hypothetical protein
MSYDENTAATLAKLKHTFGPPPVLSTENLEVYDEIMSRLIERFAPQDIIEEELVKQLTDAIWESIRYTRHLTLAIERKFRQRLEFQAQRKKLMAGRKDALARELAEKAQTPPSELERMHELQDVAEGAVSGIDEILKRTPQELDHAHALERAIEFTERLDKLRNGAIARRNDGLDQLERYREGIGHRLHTRSDQIIDGECNDVEKQPAPIAAPAIVPPAEGAQ